ncbi:hypothetical protein KJ633_05480 [bacterium]|nr:hypothetical protein [bacterium]MBU3955893.1 hypothetical protein [bacterium]
MRRFLMIVCIFFTGLSSVYGASLSTSFAEVILKDLQVGKSYSTKETAHMPLSVINNGNAAVDLKIDVLLPRPDNLKQGYEAIPDVDWIKIEKDFFPNLCAGEQAVTDVIVTIPNNKKHCGKKYQVYLRSHTVGKKGLAIAVGLRSRLLFIISQEAKEDFKNENQDRGFFNKLFIWLGLKKNE